MSNDKIFTGTVSSKNQFGATIILSDGRRGFLSASKFGDVTPSRGDSVTVVIIGEHRGKLQLSVESMVDSRQAILFIDEIEGLLPPRRENESLESNWPALLDRVPARLGKAEPLSDAKLSLVAIPGFPSVAPLTPDPRGFVGCENSVLDGLNLRDRPGPVIILTEFGPDSEPDIADPAEVALDVMGLAVLSQVKPEWATSAAAPVAAAAVAGQKASSRKDRRNGKVWSELRSFFENDRNFRIRLQRNEGKPGLVGFYKGVKCFLPSNEWSKNCSVDSLTAEGNQQWVKIVSMSRRKSSVVLSMRLSMSKDDLLKAATESQAKAAERKNRKANRVAAQERAWKESDALSVWQVVEGTVVNVSSNTSNGKSNVVYFVKVGTELVGALRENQVPFVKGTQQPRVLKVGERISVRIIRKFTGSDKRTKAYIPKLDLSMRLGNDSQQKKGKENKPRVWTFGPGKTEPGAVLAQALNERQRSEKPRGKRNRKDKNRQQRVDCGGTAFGDALKAALDARAQK